MNAPKPGSPEDLQQRQMLKVVELISEKCFAACAENFSTSKLDSREDLCIHRCTEKYLGLNQRVLAGMASYLITQGMEANDNADRAAKLLFKS